MTAPSLVGHDSHWSHFMTAHNAGRLHHGWILAGQRGVGKAGFAIEAARILVDPDNRYSNLVDQRIHPDIHIISRLPKEQPKEGEDIASDAELKRSISIDQIRAIQQILTKRPTMSDRRAIIIDAADDMERSGANALLKSLEEPSQGTFFFLISHASDRLLPTIRSRCQMLRFEPLNDVQMRHALQNIMTNISAAELDTLVAAGRGSPGQSLSFAGLDLADIEQAMDQIIQTGDADNSIRHRLSEALSLKAAQPRYEAFLRRVPGKIADEARSFPANQALPAVEAFHAADILAGRAISLSLDKAAVVLQMAHLLASLKLQAAA